MNCSMKGSGCDIVSVSRIAVLLADTKFLSKVYTKHEQNYISGKDIQTAAGLWTAKEALAFAVIEAIEANSQKIKISP